MIFDLLSEYDDKFDIDLLNSSLLPSVKQNIIYNKKTPPVSGVFFLGFKFCKIPVFYHRKYAVSYDTSRFGILDDSKAYAWAGRSLECAKGTIFENEYGSSEFFEKVNKKLSDEERKKGEAELAELRKSVKCISQPKPKRPESEVKAKDPADKKSDAGTKK